MNKWKCEICGSSFDNFHAQGFDNKIYCPLCFFKQENKRLKEDIEELNLLVGIRQKRNLISKFDKEYDEEDKKKHPNRNYAEITPDAEEVYKRYYKLKEQLKLRDEVIDEAIKMLNSFIDDCKVEKLESGSDYLHHQYWDMFERFNKQVKDILQKYKGDSNE